MHSPAVPLGAFLIGSGGPPGAMEMDPSHQHWVSKVKLRMPRHIRNDAVEDTPLVQCRSWPQPSKWFEAHKEEFKRWKEDAPHSIEETLEIVRKDLALVTPFYHPARYTTIVEGRPVQAQLYKGNFFGPHPFFCVMAFWRKTQK